MKKTLLFILTAIYAIGLSAQPVSHTSNNGSITCTALHSLQGVPFAIIEFGTQVIKTYVQPLLSILTLDQLSTFQLLFFTSHQFFYGLLILVALILALLYFHQFSKNRKQKAKLEASIREKTQELEQANEELKLSNSTKDKFFSIIAHDLKSPFNSLLGFSEILQEDWFGLDESRRFELVSIMHKTLGETYQLLINLLDWSRLQRHKMICEPDKVDLYDLVESIKSQFAAMALQKDISIISSISPNTVVLADKEMVSAILRNLLSNAIKFTQSRGRIIIYARKKEDQLHCCIEDTGVGISKDIIAKIFDVEQNTTTRGTNGEKGTGLGLILCKEFATLNKGDLHLKSQEGKGSTFCFSLPTE